MFDDIFRGVWILALFGITLPARVIADGPGADFKLWPDPDAIIISPDQKVRVEQYSKDLGDQGTLHQFWIFDQDHHHPFLLNLGEGVDLAGYPAGFRFSPDSQWLVQMQKLGAGDDTLFLYRRNGDQFSPATKKPLGDLAWDYFFSLPVWKGMDRNPDSFNDTEVELVKGMDDNYAWMGEHWPDSRYIVISLSFATLGEKPSAWAEAWRCVYDLKTGLFSVPPEFADYNAKAVKMPDDTADTASPPLAQPASIPATPPLAQPVNPTPAPVPATDQPPPVASGDNNLDTLRQKAEAGDAESQWKLGSDYEQGLGVTKNLEEANKWYLKSANQGYALSQLTIGIGYDYGCGGIQKDSGKAVKWYRKAANQNYPGAQFMLGLCYANGDGVEKNEVEAAKWYRKAAEQGNALAQDLLGTCYYGGNGVQKDVFKAVMWEYKAAAQGDPLAQETLGLWCCDGNGIKKDLVIAVKWFHKAADQGYAEAQHNLGVCYENGYGVERDTNEAIKWYQKAADQGDAEARKRITELQTQIALQAAPASLQPPALPTFLPDPSLSYVPCFQRESQQDQLSKLQDSNEELKQEISELRDQQTQQQMDLDNANMRADEAEGDAIDESFQK